MNDIDEEMDEQMDGAIQSEEDFVAQLRSENEETETTTETEERAQEEAETETDEEEEGKNEESAKVEVELGGGKVELSSLEEAAKIIENMPKNSTSKVNRAQLLLEQSGLDEEMLAMLADAKAGDTAAALALIEKLEVSEDEAAKTSADKYERKFEVVEPTELDRVANEILADDALAQAVPEWLEKAPEDFRSQVVSDPVALRLFAKHTKEGLAQKIIPLASKKSLANGTPFMEEYARLGREMTSKPAEEREEKKDEREKRTQQKKAVEATNETPSVEDIMNMSDEEFEKRFGQTPIM